MLISLGEQLSQLATAPAANSSASGKATRQGIIKISIGQSNTNTGGDA